MSDRKDFHKTFSKLLHSKLESLGAKTLNKETCIRYYTVIFENLVEILETRKVELTNEAVNYISQQFYDGVLINNTHELDPNIFDQRANLTNIPTKELVLMATMFKHTDFLYPIVEEVKRRN